jgi:choline kinase
VILAAGEGSRMGVHTEDRPKAFMDLGGRTLYARQRAVLDEYVDDVTVVLGYAADNVRDEVGAADVVVVEDWDEYDNAESLRRALQVVDDDVLVLNGDVIVTEQALEALLGAFARAPNGRSVVGCIRGDQEESTAIRCDEAGVVTDYGMIRGYQHAGVGVVDRSTVDPVEDRCELAIPCPVEVCCQCGKGRKGIGDLARDGELVSRSHRRTMVTLRSPDMISSPVLTWHRPSPATPFPARKPSTICSG